MVTKKKSDESLPRDSIRDYNGNPLAEAPQEVQINFSTSFMELRDRLVAEFLDACFNEESGEVHKMVEQLVQLRPELDTPLARFNAGQTFLIKLIGDFQNMLINRLADYLNYATQEFVATTKAREATQKRKDTVSTGGIG